MLRRGLGATIGLAFAGLFGITSVAQAQVPPLPQTQCVTTQLAGGTSDALTVPNLPCGFTTNLLVLVIPTPNTTTSPTLQMAGFPPQPIVKGVDQPLLPGDLAGYALLAPTGNQWVLLNPPNGGGGGGSAVFTTGTVNIGDLIKLGNAGLYVDGGPAFNAGVEFGLVASGNSQANALGLMASASVHVVSTVATGTGVRLPACGNAGLTVGQQEQISGLGLSQLYVYPAAGDAISVNGGSQSLGVNTPMLVNAGNGSVALTCVAAGQWSVAGSPLIGVSPIVVEPGSSTVGLDEQALAIALFNQPSVNFLAQTCPSPLPAFVPATLGDFTFAYTTQTCSFVQVGGLVYVTIELAGTPTFSTASGNLQITPLPVSAVGISNELLTMGELSGFTWPTNAQTPYGLIAAAAVTIDSNRGSGSTATKWTVATMTSGTAVSLSLSGAYMVLP